MTDLTTKLIFGADTTGAEAGVGRVKKDLASLGAAAQDAGTKGAAGVENIGKGAGAAAQKTEAATKNLIGSIQRTIATLDAGERSSVRFYESIAKQRGISTDALKPYLDQLAAAKRGAEEAGHGVEEMGFKTAGAKRELLVLAHELSQGNFSRFGGSMLVLGERTGAASLLFSKASLAVLGVVAAFGALAVAVTHAETAQRELNTLATQLTATGRAGVLSSDQLKGFIQQLSLMPGVTREAAGEVVSEFTKIHQIGGGLFRDLVGITADFAKATGQEAPAAAKALAQAFADPERGAKALDAALGTLTSTQLLQIEKMTQQNDLVGAQKVLFEALSGAVKGLADNGMTPLEKATNDLGIAWHKAMDDFDRSTGLKTVNGLLVKTIGLVKDLVENMGKLGGLPTLASSLIPGNLPGAVAGGFGAYLRSKFGPTDKAQTGGATGSFGDPVSSSGASAAANSAAQDSVKRSLAVAESYKSQAKVIGDLKQQRDNLNKSIAESIRLNGKDSDVTKALKDGVEGLNERIAAAEKKGQHKDKAYTDDAGTRMLESLRQTEASIKAQLAGEDKLTEAQKEQAKFQQLIVDLKEKKILTADQKALFAAKDSINAQLAVNVAVEHELELKKEAEKLAAKAKADAVALARTFAGINLSLESANQGRREQFDRVLSTVGLGDRARQEAVAENGIRLESLHAERNATKDAAEKGKLDSPEYKAEVARIRGYLDEALGDQKAYFAAEKAAREDWSTGAKEAFANYIDEIDNVAARAKQLLSTGLNGITDSIAGAIMGDKGSSFKDLGKRIASQIVRGMVETNITKPIAQWAQSAIAGGVGGGASGGGGVLGSLLGSLFGGAGGGGGAATGLASATAGDVAAAGPGLMFLAGGGYTGSGGKYEPAGVVHKGEYVMTAESTSKLGVNFLERLNRRGYADGGFVTSMGGTGRAPAANDSESAGNVIHIHQNFAPGTDRKTTDQAAQQAAAALRRSQRNA